jgi:hypothetical protein
MTGLASPSNMFVMPSPPVQLQIDPALQAIVPPQPSIDARANPQFVSHMSSIFTEQRATEPFTLLLFIPNPLHVLPMLLDPLRNYKTYLGKCVLSLKKILEIPCSWH